MEIKGTTSERLRITNSDYSSLLPRAVTAGVLLIVIVLIALFVQTRGTARLVEQANLINEAGRQRFRVERVLLYSLELVTVEGEIDRELARTELSETLDDLFLHSQALEYHPEHADDPDTITHDVSLSPEAIDRLDAIGVEERLDVFIAWAEVLVATEDIGPSGATAIAQYVIANEPDVLASVDAIVSELTLAIERDRDRSLLIGQLGTVAVILVVALAAAFVVIPLIRRLRDETARLRVSQERALAESRKFEELFRQVPEGLVAVDRDGLILLVNDVVASTFGYSAEEMVGQPLEILLPDRFREHYPSLVTSFFQNPTRRPMGPGLELSGRHRDGTEFPIDVSLAPLETPEGLQVIATIRDITERKATEDAVRAYARQLERSNRELEDFASVAAHDLHEPLRKIEAFGDRLEAAADGRLPEKGLDYLNRMLGATGRMRALIDDLLTYSRVSTRAKPFERVDLNEIVDTVLGNLEALIEENGGTVRSGDLPEIFVDRAQMGQVLQNLIGNALKFCRPGTPPVVEVEAELIDGVGGRYPTVCRLTVKDNGIGFDEKYLDKIFGMFERLHGRGEYPGTGIGLAVCRRILERHDGDITATSVLGEGSSFIITLPVDRLSEDQAPI